MESKYSIDLWNYYVIAHDLIEVINKHNSFYTKADKLTAYDLVEMHPYKTRNLTNPQKEEIKVKLKEFESQLPKVYYSYSDEDIEKRIIFNEVLKKYNDAYKSLK